MEYVGVCNPKDIIKSAPEDSVIIDVTSRSKTWHKMFSPFFLGPIIVSTHWRYRPTIAKNLENAWQYSKVYKEHLHNDADLNNLELIDINYDKYIPWSRAGFDNEYAVRYPMGKGAKPLFSLWYDSKQDCDLMLDYINARKQLYIPWYIKAVEGIQHSPGFDTYRNFNLLVYECDKLIKEGKKVYIWDFDVKHGLTFDDVIDNPNLKLGHGYILAKMVNDKLKEIIK